MARSFESQGRSFDVSGRGLQTVISSSSVTVIDDFERASLDHYSGNTGDATIDSNNVQNGNNSLQVASGSFAEVRSTSGLNAYPSQGDTFRVWVYLETDNIGGMAYGCQAEANRDNQYTMEVRGAGHDDIRIIKRSSGNQSTLSSSNAGEDITADTFYELEMDWQGDGTQVCTLFDVNGDSITSTTATDTDFTSGGVGFSVFDCDYDFDYARII